MSLRAGRRKAATPVDNVVKLVREAATVSDGAGPHGPTDPPPPDEPRDEDWLDEINGRHAVLRLGGKTLVMTEQPQAEPYERLDFEGIESFKAWYMNRFVPVRTPDGLRRKPLAGQWLAHPRRRQFTGLVFEPGDEAEFEREHGRVYNLWRGFEVVPREGSCDRLVAHLHDVIAGGDGDVFAWILQWFAHLVQRPRERLGTALVLRGGQGAGKTWIGRAVGELIAAHYLLVSNPAHIVGQFNAHMARLLLLQADEGFWAGDKVAEGTLKSLVTSDTLTVEPKHLNAYRVKNYVRLLVTSNERWVVPAGFDERRFAVFDVGAARAQDHDYFAALDAEWRGGGREAFLALLMTEPITLNLRRIPKTAALLDQKISSANPVASWWFGRLREGAQKSDDDEWKSWMATKALYEAYVAAAVKAGVRRPGDEVAFAKDLKRVAPGIVRKRSPSGGVRVWGYAFPDLAAARDGFEGVLGQAIDWRDDVAEGEA